MFVHIFFFAIYQLWNFWVYLKLICKEKNDIFSSTWNPLFGNENQGFAKIKISFLVHIFLCRTSAVSEK